MPSLAIVLWLANVALETAGQLCLKSAARRGERWSPRAACGIACFVVEFAAWFALISIIPLSEAMLVNALTIATVMIAGRFVFGERLDALRVGGASLVAIGVALAGAV